MFAITEKAAKEIKRIADDEGIGHYSIRVRIFSGGCSGFQRGLDFSNEKLETDEVIEFDNIIILIDHISFQYLQETTLDYQSGLFESGFKFDSKNISTSCGCGKSIDFT